MNILTKNKLNELLSFFYNNRVLHNTQIWNTLIEFKNNDFNLTIALKFAKYVYKCHKIKKEKVFYRFDSLMNFLEIIYSKELIK